MDQQKRTMAILLAFALLILCTTGCALIQKRHFWNPETANNEIIKTPNYNLIFQHGNVYLEVNQLGGWYETYFFGPPFIPIIPRFLFPPYRKKALHVMTVVEIRSPDDTIVLDFSKIRLQYSGEGISQLNRLEEWREKGRSQGILRIKVPMGRTTIDKRKASYWLVFEDVPYSAEEIWLDFGNLEINGKDVRVPTFKWRMVKEYVYEPLYNP
jgi:hypothetical protein